MGRRRRLKAESGTCNVCSAPCSSCMHLNLGFMGSKSDESSGEICHGTAASQCSANEDDALRSSRVKTHSSSYNTASEASNLLNVNSSHEALSENSESRALLGLDDVSDDSEDVEMRTKMSSAGIAPNCVLGQSNIPEDETKCVEGHQDKILCDGRANNLSLGSPNKKVDSKQLSDSSAVVFDLVLNRSGKNQGSDNLESGDAPSKEVKSEAVCDPLSNSENVKSPPCGAVNENSEAGSNKDDGLSSDGVLKYSCKNENSDKSGERIREPNSPAIFENETDDSEMVEHDVKVCDICGDAGREDLLAICSRCTDGAEHTYCMREMVQEVPEGEWLCEECKAAEETEKQKQVSEARRKSDFDVHSVTESSGKRRAEIPEVDLDAKRQAIESSKGSLKPSIPTRIAALSRDSSFKSLDKGKTKLAHQTSFTRRSNEDVDGTCSTASLVQSPKGSLFKSNSFNTLNSKPKVKHVDDVLPRQKRAKDNASIDIKEGSSKQVGKSTSFKSANLGSSYGSDSNVKMVPPKFSHPQEIKGSKQVKERSAFERKDMSKVDGSVVCSTTARSTVSTSKVDQKLTPRASSIHELKGLQADGKFSILTKQGNNLTRNRVEIPVTSVGASSTGETCSSTEKNSNQTNCKDEPPSISYGSAEGTNGISQDGLSHPRQSRNLGEKSKETFVNRPSSSLFSGSKGLAFQKEDHAAEKWPIDAPPAFDNDISVKKTFMEEVNKGNRLRAAVDAALRKKPSFCKNRGLDQPEGSFVSNKQLSSEKTSQSQLPVSKMTKNPVPLEETQGGQLDLRIAAITHKQTIETDRKQLAFPSNDAGFTLRHGELDINFLSGKPIVRDWPLAAAASLPKTSALPEHEFIWQGGLEVQRGGKLPELHCGIQAHMSTLASFKVLEVVNKFPERVLLNEVHRLSTWPTQFHESGAKEDHIALFFFAKDIESYEKNYKPLVDKMIKKDLALKGNLDGVELLIFASNQLPLNFQRWNMLFFLWGVFRGTKEDCSNPPTISCMPTLNLPQDRDLTSVLPTTHSFTNHIGKKTFECESLCNTTGLVADRDLNNKESSNKQSSIGSEENSKGPDLPLRAATSSTLAFPKEEYAHQEHNADIRPTTRLQAASANCGPSNDQKASSFVSGDGSSRKVQPIDNKEMGAMVGAIDEKTPGDEDLLTTAVLSIDQGNKVDKDPNHDQANHWKRPYLDLTGPPADNSSDVEDTSPLKDLNSVFADEGSMNKKRRTNSGGENACGSSGDISNGDGFASEKCDVGRSASGEENLQNSERAGRYVFPLDLNQSKEELELGEVPNLELALGAEETLLNIGVLPFLSGEAKEEEEDDEDAASLSLSLSLK